MFKPHHQSKTTISLSLSLSSFPLLSLSKSAAARGWDGQVGCRSVGGKAGATSAKWGKERHWGAGYVVQREETPPVGVVMLAFSFQELQSWGSVCQSFVATQTFEMRGGVVVVVRGPFGHRACGVGQSKAQ